MVHSPYTAYFAEAFTSAHIAIGVLLFALLWWTFPRFSVARTLLGLALALVTTAPLLGEFMRGLGLTTTPPMKVIVDALVMSSCLIVAGLLASRRLVLAIVACVGVYLLTKLDTWAEDAVPELCALHLIWIGTVLGLFRRGVDHDRDVARPIVERPSNERVHDVVIFSGAMLIAAITSIFVLSKADGSADEWAYTWQAAVFAKAHVYATPPACDNAFQSFYVFESMGRSFAQYTPGWPYFMTPFVALGVPWLAGPFSHGLLAVGVARVARSAVRLDAGGTSTRAGLAGWIAAAVASTGTTIVVLGASRFSHVFVAALFAWALEALIVLRSASLSAKSSRNWGIVLGSAVALLGATRPADGATLSLGLFVWFAYSIFCRRIAWQAIAAGSVAFLAWGGLTLVILHAQLGTWFHTGYSLDPIIHPWLAPKYGWPDKTNWKFALPLATGSYAWFPCSLALGFAGIASLRREARGLIVVFFVSFVALDTFYQYIDLGRGLDWGYGPRYELPFVVPMAVGASIALAPLFENARRRAHAVSALYAGGPFALAVCTMLVTTVRLWPLIYPGFYSHVHQHDSLNQRIRDMDIHHAVVIAIPGATGFDSRDLTENLPLDLYPNQDVLIAIARSPESTRCVRATFPDRAIYSAAGNPVVVTPF